MWYYCFPRGWLYTPSYYITCCRYHHRWDFSGIMFSHFIALRPWQFLNTKIHLWVEIFPLPFLKVIWELKYNDKFIHSISYFLSLKLGTTSLLLNALVFKGVQQLLQNTTMTDDTVDMLSDYVKVIKGNIFIYNYYVAQLIVHLHKSLQLIQQFLKWLCSGISPTT